MRLICMSVVCAGTREHGWTVGALRLLVLVGVDEGAVQLHRLNTREVPTAFRTAMPVVDQLLSENKTKWLIQFTKFYLL
jgi:hypothetical protein